MRFMCPLPPNAANSRRNWRVAQRDKLDYWALCDLWQAARKIRAAPPEPVQTATISARLWVWNLMDDDNAMHRLKPLLDWLVGKGYLAGDSRKHLRWTGIPEQTLTRDRDAFHVEITITPGAL